MVIPGFEQPVQLYGRFNPPRTVWTILMSNEESSVIPVMGELLLFLSLNIVGEGIVHSAGILTLWVPKSRPDIICLVILQQLLLQLDLRSTSRRKRDIAMEITTKWTEFIIVPILIFIRQPLKNHDPWEVQKAYWHWQHLLKRPPPKHLMLFSPPIFLILATYAVARSPQRKWQGLSGSNNRHTVKVPLLGLKLIDGDAVEPRSSSRQESSLHCFRGTVEFCDNFSMQDWIDVLSDTGLICLSRSCWCNLLWERGWSVSVIIRNETYHCTCILGYRWYHRLQRHRGHYCQKRQYDLVDLLADDILSDALCTAVNIKVEHQDSWDYLWNSCKFTFTNLELSFWCVE